MCLVNDVKVIDCVIYTLCTKLKQSSSSDPEDSETATPAVSILQSTEQVANVIATTLSKSKPSFTISRPNIGIYVCTYSI